MTIFNSRFNHNLAAYNAGETAAARSIKGRDEAFPAYRQAVQWNRFSPSQSASVCFVAGWLGNDYPTHDERVTS